MSTVIGSRAIFSTADYCYDVGRYEGGATCLPEYPGHNALDARPNNPARFTGTGGSTKGYELSLHANLLSDPTSAWAPKGVVIGGLTNWRAYGGGTSRAQWGLDIRWLSGSNGTSWNTVRDWTTWWPENGRHLMMDIERDALMNGNSAGYARVQQRFHRFEFRNALDDGGLLQSVSIGSIMIVGIYEPPMASIKPRFVTTFDHMNVTTGRPHGGVQIHRSGNPTRMVRGRFMSDNVAATGRLEMLLAGQGDGVYQSGENTYWERLNWLHAFVPPTKWVAGTNEAVGYPIIGYMENSRMTQLTNEAAMFDFEFREITPTTEAE